MHASWYVFKKRKNVRDCYENGPFPVQLYVLRVTHSARLDFQLISSPRIQPHQPVVVAFPLGFRQQLAVTNRTDT